MSNQIWAKNPKTPPEALAMLSTSPKAEIRLLVAENPNTPATALWHLSEDEDAKVKAVALKRVRDLPKPKLHVAPPMLDGYEAPQSANQATSATSSHNATHHISGPKQPQGFLAWLLNFLTMELKKS